MTTLEVRPWGYQRQILDELDGERGVQGRHRNLVVMATGTGKTVVAGLDYRRLRDAGQVDSLLFVAHRDEILSQSLATFATSCAIAPSANGSWPGSGRRSVFPSVQSLARLDLERDPVPNTCDMVIVDEFHPASAEAKTYVRLLRHAGQSPFWPVAGRIGP